MTTSTHRLVGIHSLFSYWKTGSVCVEVNPDPPSAEEAKPFHVAISTEGWIPVSILVFGRDSKHAVSRVRQALVECRDGQRDDAVDMGERRARIQRFIDAIDKKNSMRVEANRLSTDLICAKVNWASNGGIL